MQCAFQSNYRPTDMQTLWMFFVPRRTHTDTFDNV